jgi:hypothetical protein
MEHVELGIGGTVTSEVVVGGVMEVEAGDRVFGEDVLEEVGAGGMVGVDVSVASEVDGCVPVLLGEGGEDGVEDGEGGEEVSLAATSGEIETDMEGRGESGDVEEEGVDCWGGGGQHHDEGVQAFVPQCQRAAPGLPLVQGQGGQEGVLAVELVTEVRQGGQGQGGVTLKELRLREEDEGRRVDGSKVGK